MACLFGHKWNGCVCARCGATRDEGHNFIWKPEAGQCKEVCAICGKFGETKEHDWQPASSGTCMEQCSRCGKTRKNHRFKPVEGKLKDIKALEAIVKNKDKSIQARFEAAKEIEEKYGDLEPKRELQKLGKPGPGRHILYPTVYKEWEKVEYICLRCGKIGGREDDSESTSHYGCNFNEEPCWGN